MAVERVRLVGHTALWKEWWGGNGGGGMSPPPASAAALSSHVSAFGREHEGSEHLVPKCMASRFAPKMKISKKNIVVEKWVRTQTNRLTGSRAPYGHF